MKANYFPYHPYTSPNKRRNKSNDSLMHLFVRYVAVQEPVTYTLEEIHECTKILHYKRTNKMTPLLSVVRRKLNRVLPMLLCCKEDVNFIGVCGQTILHAFLLHNADLRNYPDNDPSHDQTIVEALLRKGASVDAVDLTRNTPVHYAASNRRIDLVQLMLQNFTKVDTLNCYNASILHELVDGYRERPDDRIVEAIRVLIGKGANFNALKNKGRRTALDIARKHGLIKVLEAFKIDQAHREQLFFQICDSASDWSNHPGELQHLDRLVDLGRYVNSRTEIQHFTPLHYIARVDRRDAVEIFLKAGANIDAATIDGVTPLHLAVMEGHLQVVKCLIERGANVHAKDSIFDFGLLHMAAFQDDKDIINLLLKCGLDLEGQSRDGFRPLHVAALLGNEWAIKRLIGHGADVNCRTLGHRLTPLHLIALANKYSFLNGLLANRYSLTFEFFAKQFNRSKLANSIILLLQVGADPNVRDSEFRTPLHHATSDNLSKDAARSILMTLLNYGAWIDAHDRQNRTPLDTYIERSFLFGLKELLRYGADVNAIPSISRTIMFAAGDYSLWQHFDLMRAVGLPINDDHKRDIHRASMIWARNRQADNLEKRDKEIARMQSHYLSDNKTTLFQFLHMKSRRRYFFARSVLCPDLLQDYPIFRIVIENRCCQAINRMWLMRLATPVLKRLVRFELPDICAEIILNFMSISQITTFIYNADSVAYYGCR